MGDFDCDEEFERFQLRNIFGDKVTGPVGSFEDAFLDLCDQTRPVASAEKPSCESSRNTREPFVYRISLAGLSPSGVWSVMMRYVASLTVGRDYRMRVSVVPDGRSEEEIEKIVEIVNDFFEQVCGCARAVPHEKEMVMEFAIESFSPR